jgi:hypothetical protein
MCDRVGECVNGVGECEWASAFERERESVCVCGWVNTVQSVFMKELGAK